MMFGLFIITVYCTSFVYLHDCPNPDYSCPSHTTCCASTNTSHPAYLCCPLPKATCCPDRQHCCPHGKVVKTQGLIIILDPMAL